jgi:chemotaxis family two-component system response regulator Rcp1
MTDTKSNILIIDDSETDSLLMEEAIKSTMMEANTFIVNSAAEAFKFLNQKDERKDAPRPDLILLDLKLPDYDGHDFLTVIKKDPRLLTIPVVVLTTSTRDADITKSYQLHANCYVVKPVNFMKFKKVISVINDFWLGIAKLPPRDA